MLTVTVTRYSTVKPLVSINFDSYRLMLTVNVTRYSTVKLLVSIAIDSYRLMSRSIIATRCSTPSFHRPSIILLANQALTSHNVVLTSVCATQCVQFDARLQAGMDVAQGFVYKGGYTADWDCIWHTHTHTHTHHTHTAWSSTATSEIFSSCFYILFR